MSSFLAKVKTALTSPAFNNIRAILYVALPAALTALVKMGRLSQDHANLWTAVGIAALSPLIAAIWAPAGLRTYLFGLLIPVQALLVAYGGANNMLGVLVAAIATAFISNGLAAANVHKANAASRDA